MQCSKKRTEEIKEGTLGIIPYPSIESLQEFDSNGIDEQQYCYYACKAEKIKKKMDQAIKAFHEKDEYYWDLTQYDEFYAEYIEHNDKFQRQLERIRDILCALVFSLLVKRTPQGLVMRGNCQ